MIEIIRINSKFKKAISRLSDKDKAYILDGIFALSTGENFELKDNQVGDLLELIQGENEKMCIKAIGKANFENLTIGETIGEDHRGRHKVKESNIKEDKIKEDYSEKIENLIIKWNKIKETDNYWKGTLGKNDTRKLLNKIFSAYTTEEIQNGVVKYLEDIQSRNTSNDYSKHRFTIDEFFTQGNGFKKFYLIK